MSDYDKDPDTGMSIYSGSYPYVSPEDKVVKDQETADMIDSVDIATGSLQKVIETNQES